MEESWTSNVQISELNAISCYSCPYSWVEICKRSAKGVREKVCINLQVSCDESTKWIECNQEGTDTIDGYFQKLKQFCDKQVVVLVFLDDEELLHIALNGLPPKYDSFSSAIRTHSDVLSVEEINTLLNTKERVIKKRFDTNDANSMAMAASLSLNVSQEEKEVEIANQRGRGVWGNYNGNGGYNSNSNSNGGYSNPGGYNCNLGPQYHNFN